MHYLIGLADRERVSAPVAHRATPPVSCKSRWRHLPVAPPRNQCPWGSRRPRLGKPWLAHMSQASFHRWAPAIFMACLLAAAAKATSQKADETKTAPAGSQDAVRFELVHFVLSLCTRFLSLSVPVSPCPRLSHTHVTHCHARWGNETAILINLLLFPIIEHPLQRCTTGLLPRRSGARSCHGRRQEWQSHDGNGAQGQRPEQEQLFSFQV